MQLARYSVKLFSFVKRIMALDPSDLFIAISSFDDDGLERCLSRGLSVASSQLAGVPPLIFAASWGNASAVRRLLEAGACIDQTDENGRSALLTAMAMNDLEMAALLIEHGAKKPTHAQLAEHGELSKIWQRLQLQYAVCEAV